MSRDNKNEYNSFVTAYKAAYPTMSYDDLMRIQQQTGKV